MKRNLLISRPDNRTYVDENGNFRPAFHIIERDSYTPIEDGYQDTVFVREMDEAGILERVQAAIDYAREQGIPVQVNHVMVRASIGNARVDARGIEIVPGPGDEANAPEWSGPEWVTARTYTSGRSWHRCPDPATTRYGSVWSGWNEHLPCLWVEPCRWRVPGLLPRLRYAPIPGGRPGNGYK